MRLVKKFEDRLTRKLRRKYARQVRKSVATENWWFVAIGHVDGTQRVWRIKPAKSDKALKHLENQLSMIGVKMTDEDVPTAAVYWPLTGVIQK